MVCDKQCVQTEVLTALHLIACSLQDDAWFFATLRCGVCSSSSGAALFLHAFDILLQKLHAGMRFIKGGACMPGQPSIILGFSLN